MAKLAWHTDIVVDGQGMGLSLKPGRDGCFDLAVMPDVPGRVAKRALRKFKKALDMQPPACSATEAKTKVARAVKTVKAAWNKWHREAYRR
jgi:hypothetical protein